MYIEIIYNFVWYFNHIVRRLLLILDVKFKFQTLFEHILILKFPLCLGKITRKIKKTERFKVPTRMKIENFFYSYLTPIQNSINIQKIKINTHVTVKPKHFSLCSVSKIGTKLYLILNMHIKYILRNNNSYSVYYFEQFKFKNKHC